LAMDPLTSYHLFEEAVEKHARLLGEARSLLARIARNPDDTGSQERLLRVLRSFRVIRARLAEQGGMLASVDGVLLGYAATLLEYMLLVGLEEELEIVSRAISLSARSELFSREAGILEDDKHKIEAVRETLSQVLSSLPQN
jgi:hypothetical protein